MQRQRLLGVEVGWRRLCLLPELYLLLGLSLEELPLRCHFLGQAELEECQLLELLLVHRFPFQLVGLVEGRSRCLERGLAVVEQFPGKLAVRGHLLEQQVVYLPFQLWLLVLLDRDRFLVVEECV
jgi:hypothetical protein